MRAYPGDPPPAPRTVPPRPPGHEDEGEDDLDQVELARPRGASPPATLDTGQDDVAMDLPSSEAPTKKPVMLEPVPPAAQVSAPRASPRALIDLLLAFSSCIYARVCSVFRPESFPVLDVTCPGSDGEGIGVVWEGPAVVWENLHSRT